MLQQTANWWRRNWRAVVVLAVAVVVLVLAVRTVAGWWIGRQLGAEVARLEKVYGGLSTHDMNQWVPQAENRARVMRSASELVVIHTSKGSSLMSSPMFNCLLGGECAAGVTDSMRQFVDQNRLAVYVATQGRTLPRAAWGVHYFRAETTDIPIGMPLNNLLSAACRVELEEGHLDRAVEMTLTGLSIASSIHNEWSRMMQSWRILGVEEQAGCIQEMLQRAEPSPQALSGMAAALADSRWPDPMRMALMGEVRIANAWFLELERGRIVRYPTGGSSLFLGSSVGDIGPVTWLLRPVVSHRRLGDLRALDHLIRFQALAPFQRDAAHMTPPGLSPDEQRRASGWGLRWPALAPLRATFVTSLQWDAIDFGWEFHSVLNAAEICVALRRYRLDHGSYPDTLAQLVPQYLPWVPVDPFIGRQPEYAKQGSGFELHVHKAKANEKWMTKLFDWKIPR